MSKSPIFFCVALAALVAASCQNPDEEQQFDGSCLHQIPLGADTIVGEYELVASSIGVGSYELISIECEHDDVSLEIIAATEGVRNDLEQIISSHQCQNHSIHRAQVKGKLREDNNRTIIEIDKISIKNELDHKFVLSHFNINTIDYEKDERIRDFLFSC